VAAPSQAAASAARTGRSAGRGCARDQPTGGGKHPAGDAELAGRHVKHGGQADRGTCPDRCPPPGQRAEPGHGGARPGGQAQPGGKHLLGDGRERHVDGHLEQRQPMPPARNDQVIGDRAERGVPGGERHGTGRGHRGDEGLRIGRGAAPHQAGQDDLAAGEVPARVQQVGGEHPVHLPVQGVLADQYAQPQVRRLN